ncbi:MAG: S1 RNA-binding domain-containing protein [Nitrospinota bacterium]
MVQIGKKNKLEVVKEVDFGVYLDGGSFGEILLPKKFLHKDCRPGQLVEVFIYMDSEDLIIATTQKPFAQVEQFAFLKVVSVTPVGAFLDWGLDKDLLVPFSEQRERMEEGKAYVVYLYLDSKTDRIVASSRISRFLESGHGDFKEEQETRLLIWEKTQVGYKAVINGRYEGLIFEEDVFQPLREGQQVKGYIKKLRDDGKIDLFLEQPGYKKIGALAERIFSLLQEKGGFLHISNQTEPETIYRVFGVSKKNYKKAIGALYKKRVILIEEDGIRLTGKGTE